MPRANKSNRQAMVGRGARLNRQNVSGRVGGIAPTGDFLLAQAGSYLLANSSGDKLKWK